MQCTTARAIILNETRQTQSHESWESSQVTKVESSHFQVM